MNNKFPTRFKALDENGEWREGSFIVRSGRWGRHCYILELTHDLEEPDKEYKVNPETLQPAEQFSDKEAMPEAGGGKREDAIVAAARTLGVLAGPPLAYFTDGWHACAAEKDAEIASLQSEIERLRGALQQLHDEVDYFDCEPYPGSAMFHAKEALANLKAQKEGKP